MKNPKHLKYLKLFESFFEMNELMGHLKEIAKKLIQNLPEQEDEISMGEYKIKVALTSNLDDTIRKLNAEIYENENRVATIFIDFESPEFPNNIVVSYELNMTNEGHIISNYMPKGIFERDLLNIYKPKRKTNWRKNLSQELPK